ncbi:MAG: hypothetical protein R6V43_13685, partial [Halopseudomonas sp.]
MKVDSLILQADAVVRGKGVTPSWYAPCYEQAHPGGFVRAWKAGNQQACRLPCQAILATRRKKSPRCSAGYRHQALKPVTSAAA